MGSETKNGISGFENKKTKKTKLCDEIDNIILDQDKKFYAYDIARQYFEMNQIKEPDRKMWFKMQNYVSQRVRYLRDTGKIKKIGIEKGDGSHPRVMYKVKQ